MTWDVPATPKFRMEYSEGSIIDRVERSIDKVADFHNVSTDVLYNYIDNETGI